MMLVSGPWPFERAGAGQRVDGPLVASANAPEHRVHMSNVLRKLAAQATVVGVRVGGCDAANSWFVFLDREITCRRHLPPCQRNQFRSGCG